MEHIGAPTKPLSRNAKPCVRNFPFPLFEFIIFLPRPYPRSPSQAPPPQPSLPLAHPSSCSTTNGLLIPVHHHTSPSFFSHFRPYRPKPNKKAYSRPITFHNRTLQSSNHTGNHCRPPNPPPSLPSNPSCSAVAWLELPTLAFRSRRALVPLGRPSPHASFQSM